VNDHGRTELGYWVGAGAESPGVDGPPDALCPAGDLFWASNLILIRNNLLTGPVPVVDRLAVTPRLGVRRHQRGRQAGNALSSCEIRMLDAVSASCAERAA
jgi:hypothetical protein